MKHLFAALGLSLVLAGCAPRIITQATRAASPATALTVPTAFLVIRETETFTDPAEELGDIQIKDAGFTLNCDYETTIELASQQARQLGANVLKIYEHQLPDMWRSTCHRIRAKALRVTDLTPYEKEIVWQPTRRLRQIDFKASTASRPFEAATSSGVRYHYAGRLFQGKVQLTVETYFDCQNSYFKGTRNSALTLAHEQGHFDLTEIYARRFAKALQEQVADTRELEAKQQAIYHQIMTEAQTRQDKYDSEVYADRSRQPAWLAEIAQELQATQAYAGKQLTIKLKV